MDIDIEYLISYLEDELRDIPNLRIHPVAPTGTKKSVDLPQDYDPNASQVHLNRGVRIRADSREFFFPAYWVNGHLDEMRKQAEYIREYCLGILNQ